MWQRCQVIRSPDDEGDQQGATEKDEFFAHTPRAARFVE
jgi:hypothetical protein